LVPQDFLDGLNPARQAGRYEFAAAQPTVLHTLLAADGAEILGHITIGPSRDTDPVGFGEVRSLYVDPAHWGTGVGRTLLDAGCTWLRQAGHDSALLWVLFTNVRARRFYEAAGWQADGAVRTEEFGPDKLGKLSFDQVRYRARLR
jgi:GNAT superfamily N-acetyltransferase